MVKSKYTWLAFLFTCILFSSFAYLTFVLDIHNSMEFMITTTWYILSLTLLLWLWYAYSHLKSR